MNKELTKLSDKPQISEEDFDKLKDELLSCCKEIYCEAIDCGCDRNAKDMGFEDGFDCDVSFYLKDVLEKYLKPQPPRTQGDKIRAMSNEELTKEIYKFFIKYEWCALDGKEYICFNEKGFLEFLNSEVKEDE